MEKNCDFLRKLGLVFKDFRSQEGIFEWDKDVFIEQFLKGHFCTLLCDKTD